MREHVHVHIPGMSALVTIARARNKARHAPGSTMNGTARTNQHIELEFAEIRIFDVCLGRRKPCHSWNPGWWLGLGRSPRAPHVYACRHCDQLKREHMSDGCTRLMHEPWSVIVGVWSNSCFGRISNTSNIVTDQCVMTMSASLLVGGGCVRPRSPNTHQPEPARDARYNRPLVRTSASNMEHKSI